VSFVSCNKVTVYLRPRILQLVIFYWSIVERNCRKVLEKRDCKKVLVLDHMFTSMRQASGTQCGIILFSMPLSV